MAFFEARQADMALETALSPLASCALAGSSRANNTGLANNALANPNLCRWPPDNLFPFLYNKRGEVRHKGHHLTTTILEPVSMQKEEKGVALKTYLPT